MNTHTRQGRLFLAAAGALALACTTRPVSAGESNTYLQTNLDANQAGQAQFTDPDLVNPWGIAESGSSPFWISDEGAGLSTLYNSAGVKNTAVIVNTQGSATGVVFNGSSASFGGAHFIFDTEQGTISAWSGGANAVTKVNQGGSANFTGLAIGSSGGSNYLYAANFGVGPGSIEVFNSSFAPVTLAGNFTDPNLPAGYAPFNVQNIGGDLYVEYALQRAGAPDSGTHVLGDGYVDVYSTNGDLLERLISNGQLDAPWGVALAPSDFGPFSNDLLVGNFGNGEINAYNPVSGAFEGTLDNWEGQTLEIPGLWALQFGNGGSGGLADDLYFTSGPGGQRDGLFGSLSAVPDGSSAALLFLCAGLGLLCVRRYGRDAVA